MEYNSQGCEIKFHFCRDWVWKKKDKKVTAKKLQKRRAKAEMLRVLQTEDGSSYAESAEGKILYRVTADDRDTEKQNQSAYNCIDFLGMMA